MYKAMKIKKLKKYGIPSYVMDIWEEQYSPYLLPLQEEAVRNYGVLDCRENNNILVIAPPSSGEELPRRDGHCSTSSSSEKVYLFSPFQVLR